MASNTLAGTYTRSGHSGAAHTNPTIATALTAAQASHRVNVNTTDYDTDNNGLIEINSPEQLNAARWDLTGAGAPTAANAAHCAAAFPARSHSHRCPDTDAADTNPGHGLGCELTRDLDFDDGAPGDRTDDSHYNSNAGWTPIADGSTRYSGIFESNGHTISDLYINLSTTAASDGCYAARFGRLTGTVRNVGLVNPYIKNARTAGAGYIYTGALAGWSSRAVTVSGSYADDLPPEGKTAAALQSPTGYTGIYATWDDANVDGDSRPDRPWRFGDRCQYPALAIGGHRPSRQRGNAPPCAAAEYVAPPIVYNLNIRSNVKGISLDDSQSTTYQVRMSAPPLGHPARVSITGNNPDVTVSPTAVHFTAADYNRWQTVAITALRDANNTAASASLAHRRPSYSCGSIIVSDTDTWPSAVAEQVNGHTVTMRHEPAAPLGVTVTLTALDTLDTNSDITIGGPPADAPNGAPGCGIGQSPPARMPSAGLTICLPAPAVLLAEAGEHPLTLLRCATGAWTPVAGSDRDGDGIAAVPVRAAGVMEYGLFAVAYTLPQLGPVSNMAAAAGDTAGAITLTLTPGANAAAPWIAGVIQTEPSRLAIWQIAGNPGSQAFTGPDSGASCIFTATAGRGECDSSEWTAWASWVSATPD